MNKLKVKCIRCGKEWKKDSSVAWQAEHYTSSLCNSCFLEVAAPTIKKKQLKEGNFDCFATAGSYCDQLNCKYRRWCLYLEQAREQQDELNAQKLEMGKNL